MLLRSIRTVERLRKISSSSVYDYLTSPSFSQRYNAVRSYVPPHRVTTESAFSTHISSFCNSVCLTLENENWFTTSVPVSSRRISIRHMSRRRKAEKRLLNSPAVGKGSLNSAAAAVELALDSVVKIFAVSTSPSYFLPWQNKSQRESMGSGFVISGRKIITNAHVVADHTFVLVRKHGSPIKHRAEVQAVGHECDLAILVIDSEVFWEGMNPLELGDIPILHGEVAVVGYPQGGDNISVTKGVVSRVEQTQYVHGATQLMAIQIDAAINPGNSGGPAIMGNKVAGVAFQNLSGAENIGYIIPTPVINHFISGVEKCGKYVGFCSMGISCQPMENDQMRSHFQMSLEMTGVLINKINPLSDAHEILKKDDVILTFDGVPIANDGTVPLRNRERITFDHLVSMKKPNEKALVKVMREGKELEFSITLKPLQPLVPVHQFDQLPSYYIFAGFVFVPLTQPYLHEYGEDWYNTCPRGLCERALKELPKKAGQQLVIVSQVLMDDINRGYQRLSELQVKKVNGVEVDNMRHLRQLIENCNTEDLRIDLENDERVIILNYQSAKMASSMILKRHRIASAVSSDLHFEQNPETEFASYSAENSDKTGVGWVLKKLNGDVVVHGRGRLPATATPAEAEARALLFAVMHLSTLHYDNISFYTDSKQVVDQFYASDITHSPMSIILQDVKHVLRQMGYTTLSHIARQFNKEADLLAKLAFNSDPSTYISWNPL